MAAIGRARGRGLAAMLSFLAVLMLLAVPALSGRAHAAMPGMDMAGMARMDQAAAPRSEASPPVHGADEALCVIACSLAGQLIAPASPKAAALPRSDEPVRYFIAAPRLSGVSEAPGSPPPR